ncbi:MAG: alkyl hydroperoxide reductase/Thiol specific antioxidant/Mal allergen [Bacteroidetes bacterium]|nr:alkyl hydroperoxide reductase/Thiol specific antioxidant/Mal allergen [Bacteroidota bacterium]
MTKLKVGTKAPAINSVDQNGEKITLAQFKGKKVILYFYPADDTPTCTKEACNYRDNFAMLKKKGYVILGVSMDPPKKHQKFIKKYDLPFTLIADEDKKVIDAYDVWHLKKFMGREFMGIVRTTFLIDEKGFIEKIIEKVDSANATAQILTAE